MIDAIRWGMGLFAKGREKMIEGRTAMRGVSFSCVVMFRSFACAMLMTAIGSPAFAQQQSTSANNPLATTLQNLLSGQPNSLQQVIQGQANGPQVISPSVSPSQTVIGPSGQIYTYTSGAPGSQTGMSGGVSGQPTLPGPTQSTTASLPQTRLEQIMSQRAGVPLYQFGYDQVGVGQSVSVPQVGAVQDNYILGPGDEVDVTLRGQQNVDYRATVDRDGRLILPNVSPVAAGGRSVGEFRTDLTNLIHRSFISTQVFVSVAQLRQVSVMVVGEVNNPGLRTLTGLSSPLDAILVSGGIKKTGSLRNIKVYRAGNTIPYDLYDVLTQHGTAKAVFLADGDRIVVPPLGATVAATGWVRRPAIYELPKGAAGISARSLISLAGGLEVRGRYRLAVLELKKDGRQDLTEIRNEGATVHDSEILYAQASADETVGGATLSGGQTLAGQYSISRGGKLSALLKEPGALGSSPYAVFGVIVRRDPHTYIKSLIAFSPAAVVEGLDDVDLESNDIVRVFSTAEGALLIKTSQDYQTQQQINLQAQRNPQFNDQLAQAAGQGQSSLTQTLPPNSNGLSPAITGLPAPSSPSSLSALLASQQGQAGQRGNGGNQGNGGNPGSPGNTATPPAAGGANSPVAPTGQMVQLSPTGQPMVVNVPPPVVVNGLNLDQELTVEPIPVAANAKVDNFTQLTTQLGVDPIVLIDFLIDHQVRLDGAVRAAGVYIVGPHTSLSDLVSVAGGTVRWADQSGVELISTTVDPVTGRAKTTRQVLPLNGSMLASYTIQPRDEIRFSEVYTDVDAGQVTIQGEVRSPGTFPILRGEHLSEVLVRAGGLTDVAYPYGTVFLRQSVAALEEIGFQRAADDVERQVLVGMGYAAQAGGGGAGASASGSAFQSVEIFANELRQRKPLGRMSIVADPSVLAAHPEKDPIMEPGDVIYIPQRPSTVTVLGEVMQPGSFAVDPSNSPKDYIKMAGGAGQFADEGWTFVVYPDGTAQQVDSSWFKFDRQALPPGSVIYVPRDLFPLNWAVVVNDAGEIFKDLAISAAALVAIQNNNIHCTAGGTRCN